MVYHIYTKRRVSQICTIYMYVYAKNQLLNRNIEKIMAILFLRSYGIDEVFVSSLVP